MGLYQKDFLNQSDSICWYQGVEINAIEHKISLFSDNVMIYSAGPNKHFTNLMQVLEKFNEYVN